MCCKKLPSRELSVLFMIFISWSTFFALLFPGGHQQRSHSLSLKALFLSLSVPAPRARAWPDAHSIGQSTLPRIPGAAREVAMARSLFTLRQRKSTTRHETCSGFNANEKDVEKQNWNSYDCLETLVLHTPSTLFPFSSRYRLYLL